MLLCLMIADWWQTLAMLGGWPEWSIMDDNLDEKPKGKTELRKSLLVLHLSVEDIEVVAVDLLKTKKE